MRKCDRCGRVGSDKIHIAIRDAIKEQTFCLNCMSIAFLENELSFINDLNLIDDISGNIGAVEFVYENERYCLERRTMMRLISYNLQRHEYLILADKYGTDNHMLNDGLYWNSGEKLQEVF